MFQTKFEDFCKEIKTNDKHELENARSSFIHLIALLEQQKFAIEYQDFLKATVDFMIHPLISRNILEVKKIYVKLMLSLIRFKQYDAISFFSETLANHYRFTGDFDFTLEFITTGLYFSKQPNKMLQQIMEDIYGIRFFEAQFDLMKHYLIKGDFQKALVILKLYARLSESYVFFKQSIQSKLQDWVQNEFSFHSFKKDKTAAWFETFLKKDCDALLVFFKSIGAKILFEKFYNQCMAIADDLKLEEIKFHLLSLEKEAHPVAKKVAYSFPSLHEERAALIQYKEDLVKKIVNDYPKNILNSLRKLTQSVIAQLPEKPCEFEIIYFGSLAQGDFTVGSDIDLGFLIHDESCQQHPYFKTLFQCLDLTFKCLGYYLYTENYTAIYIGHATDGGDLRLITTTLTHSPIRMAEKMIETLRTPIQGEITEAMIKAKSLLFARSFYSTSSLTLYAQFKSELVTLIAKNPLQMNKLILPKSQAYYIHLKDNLMKPLKIALTELSLLHPELLFNDLTQLLNTLAKLPFVSTGWVRTLKHHWQWLNTLRTQTRLQRPGPEDILFWEALPKDMAVSELEKIKKLILQGQISIHLTAEQKKRILLIETILLKPFYGLLPKWTESFHHQEKIWDPLTHYLIETQDYSSFIDYLLQGDARPEDHLYYYQKVPDAKRFKYYQVLHQATQSHQNPKLAHDILTLVGQYPLKNGWRAAPLFKQQQWHQLMHTFLSDYQENECFIEMQNLNNENEVTRYGLSSEFKQALFEPGKTYFRKSDETQLLNAQHKVLAIPNSKHPKFWCKFFPENPGGEAFDSIFSGLLTGEAGPNHLFAILHIPYGASIIKIPVLLSQHVPGSSLSEKEITEEPQKLNRINVISFLKAFLRVVFLNPEDDRGEDYKLTPMEHSDEFELIAIDRERTNYSSHEKKIISDKLLVKSMIYCLNQMETEIPEHNLLLYLRDIIEPELLLETFLHAAEKLAQLYSKLISPADLESYFNDATETQLKILQHPEEKKFMTAGIYVFVIRPDSIKDLFNTFTLLKELLTTTTEHLRPKMLLNILQPKIASVYQPLFTLIPMDKKHPEQALTRFWSIKEVKQELICVQGVTKSSRFNLAKTHAAATPEQQYKLELKDLKDIYEGKPHPCSIETAKLELQNLNNNKLLIAKDLCQAYQGRPLTLFDWYRLLTTFQLLSSKQKVYLLNELEKEVTTLQATINEPNNARWKDWLPLIKTDRATLIRTLMDIAFTLASKMNWVRLDLSFYETCFKDDSALENFLQQTGAQLMALTLSNINQQTGQRLLKALKYCPYLTSLTIQQSTLNFTQTSPPLKNLIYLKLKDCKVNDADLKKMIAHPEHLHTLIIEGDNQVLYADDYCEFPFLLSTPWEKMDVEIKESIMAELKRLHTYDITPVRAELLQALILLLKKEYPNSLEIQKCIQGFRLPVKAHPTLYQATSESLEKATLLNQLGLQYHGNPTAFQYEKKAAYWFQKAARLKLAEAQYHLAYCYDEGMGVPQNKIKAFEYYYLAALQEHVIAQNNLGLCYLLGEGVEKNETLALHWFETAAKKELAAAFYHLAVCYEWGYGTQKNSAQALRYYELAATQNHAAQCALGFYLLENEHHAELKALFYIQESAKQENLTAQRWLRFYYQTIQDKKLADDWDLKLQNYGDKQKRTIKTLNFKYGKNIQHETKKAVQYYQKWADQDNAVAQYNLGVCYDNGRGVSQDSKQAVFWYQKAANLNNASAQFNLGVCYDNGRGVSQDFKQAVFWYQKAADLGDASAQCNLGGCYYNGRGLKQDFQQAVFWYQKAADQGYAPAQYNLGVCYEKGQGVNQDFKQAFFWYQKAADQGLATAQFNLGVCYQNGRGVSQDFKQAVFWYQKAADLGDTDAQYNLGICYKNAQGVKQDDQQAVFWYQKAADQGHASAQCYLGFCYKNGQGVKQDLKQAVFWYQKAANLGNAAAQFNLGVCYDNGEGVKQDYQQAVFWFQKAANQGDKDAVQRIEALLKEQPELKKLMGNAHNFYSSVSAHSLNPKEAQSYSLQ